MQTPYFVDSIRRTVLPPNFLYERPSVETLVPPPELRDYIGAGEFLDVGNHFLEIFKNQAGLQPHERILDVGCGIGRMAVPLTQYLNRKGRYAGFDVTFKGIEWGQKNITPVCSNFKFDWVNLYNSLYNSIGTLKSTEFRFPYPSKSFDFAFLTSVFTHLLPEEVDHYLSEIRRVLTDKGRVLATFFLWNPQNVAWVEKEKANLELDFKYDFGTYRVIDDKAPMVAVVFDEGYVREVFAKNGFALQDPWLGKWCGRKEALTYQDCLLARKA